MTFDDILNRRLTLLSVVLVAISSSFVWTL
jgi:hypothetical protein